MLSADNSIASLLVFFTGYYSMDTEKVRRDMRVVLPSLDDVSSLGIHIQQECEDFASYKLEKYVSGGKYSFRGNAIK